MGNIILLNLYFANDDFDVYRFYFCTAKFILRFLVSVLVVPLSISENESAAISENYVVWIRVTCQDIRSHGQGHCKT